MSLRSTILSPTILNHSTLGRVTSRRGIMWACTIASGSVRDGALFRSLSEPVFLDPFGLRTFDSGGTRQVQQLIGLDRTCGNTRTRERVLVVPAASWSSTFRCREAVVLQPGILDLASRAACRGT
jgi:hypothetical protein